MYRPFCPRERTLVLTAYEAGWAPYWVWTFRETENPLSFPLSLSLILSLSLSLSLYIYMCVCVCVCARGRARVLCNFLFYALQCCVSIGKTSPSKTFRKITTFSGIVRYMGLTYTSKLPYKIYSFLFLKQIPYIFTTVLYRGRIMGCE